MKEKSLLQQQIVNEWLLGRGISQEVLNDAGVHFDGQRIVIPVKDINGNIIFNKYRRHPNSTEGPKYWYEKGSTAALYNVHTLVGKHKEKVFITESELDSLLLNSLGFNAVSSTGGSQTFHPEWFLDFLNNDVYLVLDNDDAGIRGALRINTMLTSAKIIFLPKEKEKKDVTDYFKTHTIKQFLDLAEDATSWVIPADPQILPKNKSGIDAITKEIRSEMDSILKKQRILNQEGKTTRHTEIMLEVMGKRLEHWKKIREQWGTEKKGEHLDDIARAKTVPITQFIKFSSSGFALCLWHSETTASMKYRPERSRVYCHGCSAHKDVIDVVMAINNCTFNEALKIILNRG